MSQIRLNFLNWRPDADELGNDGLIQARNVLHDTEGYKPLHMQTSGAFSVDTFYTSTTLTSVRAMQVRAVGANANKVAAIAKDRATTATMADLSIGVEGESAQFTAIATGTLVSGGGVRCLAFSLAEMESGAFGMAAAWNASLAAGGSTVYVLSGEATFTITSESESTTGVTATASLAGTQASHTRQQFNADTYAGMYIKNDGVEYSVGADNTSEGTSLGNWLDSGGPASALYIYATLTSGSLGVDSGTGLWLPLSVSRKWAVKRTSAGTGTAVVDLSIATDEAGTDVINTATYTMIAVKEGVTLTNDTIAAQDATSATAGVRINTDGTVDQNVNGVFSQINSGTDWIIPNSAADSTYYAKLTTISGDAPDSGTTGTWLQMTSNRAWSLTQSGGAGVSQGTWELAVSNDGGVTTLDTARYTVEADTT